MNKNIFLIVIIFSVFAFNLSAENEADEILSKVILARGKGEKINTLRIEGRMTISGVAGTFEIYNKRPFMNRMNLELFDKKIIQTIDSTEGWYLNEVAEQNNAQKMLPEVYERAKMQNFYMKYPLENYKSKGIKLEYKGKSMLDSNECFVITAVMTDSSQSDMYFDTRSYYQLLQKTVAKQPNSKEVTLETYFKNYKDIGGLVIPYFIESKADGESQSKMLIEKVGINEKIDDSIFNFPTK